MADLDQVDPEIEDLDRSVESVNYQSTFITAGSGYVIFVIVYMILYDYFDTYTSSFYQVVVSHITTDLGIEISEWYLMLSVASIGLFAVLFIQYLTDIIGRKPVMIFVFLGMGTASVLLGFTQSPITFTIVFFFMWMFFSSDVWIIIMAEEAPKEKRGRYIFLVTFLAAFGAVTIPIARDLLVTTDVSTWRRMAYFAVVAIPLAFLGLFMKETSAYRTMRAQQEKIQHQRTFKTSITKFLAPFSTNHGKKLIVFIVTGFLLGICFAANSTQEAFVTQVVGASVADEQFILDKVNDIVFIMTLGALIFQMISGFLCDKFGRKPMFIIYMIINSVSALTFGLFSANFADQSAYGWVSFLGFMWIGSFWAVYLMTKAYCVESFPTDIRGTASGWRAFSYAFGVTIGGLISSGLSQIMDLGLIFGITSTLVAVFGIPLAFKFLPETNALDLTQVSGLSD